MTTQPLTNQELGKLAPSLFTADKNNLYTVLILTKSI